MTTTTSMLETYPAEIKLGRGRLAATIDVLLSCAEACTACADACLSERSVAELVTCVRVTTDCADICGTTARVLLRHTGYDAVTSRALLEACAVTCGSCGDECWAHVGMHEHCRICAEACRACERACRELVTAIG